MRKLLIGLSLFFSIFILGITVNATDASKVSVAVSVSFDEDNKNIKGAAQNKNLGDVLLLDAANLSSNEFKYWIINGFVRTDLSANLELRVQSKMDIHAIFCVDGSHAVLFMDSNGKLIDFDYVLDGEDATPPSVIGYTKPGNLVVDNDNPWKTLNGNESSLDNIKSSKIYVLQYKLQSDANNVYIRVNGGVNNVINAKVNDVVTITPENPDTFKYWESEDGNVLSYNPTYSFTALENNTIQAMELDKEAVSFVIAKDLTGIRPGYNSYMGRFELHGNDQLIEFGFIYADTIQDITLDTPNVKIAKSNVASPLTNEFLMSFVTNHHVTTRAYMMITNGEEIRTIYSDLVIKPEVKEIEEIRGLTVDTSVKTYGIVTGINGTKYVFIEDLKGEYAIVLHNPNIPEGLAVGDEVLIEGNIDIFDGLINITSGTIKILNSGNVISDAQNLETVNLITIDNQSKRYNMNDLTVVLVSEQHLVVKDALNNEITICVDDTNRLDLMNILSVLRTGDLINVKNMHLIWFTNPHFLFNDVNEIQINYAKRDIDTIKFDDNEFASNTNIMLPVTGLNGSLIDWESSNPEIISITGEIILPLNTTVVTLKAKATKDSLIYENEYTFTIIGVKDQVEPELDEIELPSEVTSNLDLPNETLTGKEIIWTSSNTSIITNLGIVMRQVEDVNVTLTVSITFGGYTLKKDFTITVKKKEVVPALDPITIILTESSIWSSSTGSYVNGNFEKAFQGMTIKADDAGVYTGTWNDGKIQVKKDTGWLYNTNIPEGYIIKSITVNGKSAGLVNIYFSKTASKPLENSITSVLTSGDVSENEYKYFYIKDTGGSGVITIESIVIELVGKEGTSPIEEDTIPPVIHLTDDIDTSYEVGDIWNVNLAQSWCLAIDGVDGQIACLVDDSDLELTYVDGYPYLQTPGSYTIIFIATDRSGNISTLTVNIIVTDGFTLFDIDYSGFSNYYITLNSSTNIIRDLAKLLRNTITYVSYGDARYIYATYDNGSQVVLYDVPGSSSYRKVPATGTSGWGSSGNISGNGFSITLNREHVWACSDMRIMPSSARSTITKYESFVLLSGSFDYRPSNINKGHYSDLHNLWNSLAGPNGTHSDHFYGEENGSSVGPYLRNSIFYPGDEYKGDIARILFYMTLMYPHLTLVERGDSRAHEGSIYYGYLDDLLKWNLEDPVSDVEIRRNQTIFATQGNRNPFVDFYQYGFAELIFAYGDPNVLDN